MPRRHLTRVTVVDAKSLHERLVAAWRLNTTAPGPKEALLAAMEALLADARALGDPAMLFKVRVGHAYALRHEALEQGSARARSEMFAALRECVRFAYAEPELADRSHVKAMWTQLFIVLDWIIGTRPEPADRVRRLLDELDRHVPAGRPWTFTVGSARMSLEARCGNVAEVERIWRGLRAEWPPREGFRADRVATSKAIIWTRLGRHRDAIAALAPVLAGQVPRDETVAHEGALLMPYLHTGRADEAVAAHHRTYTRTGVKHGIVAAQLEFCARTGNEERGVEVLRLHLADIEDGCDSVDTMWTAAAAALLCGRLGRGWAELGERLHEQAVAFAARLDRLNGTSHAGASIGALLHAEPLHDRLPLPDPDIG
ncbi:hypothetical protein [Actinomadura algeriensis]|uniref:Tetratricopeptide repeat protein n=1 Tax=Actinomadura algeriensis TaxID=1679523 RepID=A0ABR9K319_9ACTN|nr:hypothetical protein [Actinomadura algeriensis]MBE1537251.1 hypothetical protein [Actinomadura algeriensis]